MKKKKITSNRPCYTKMFNIGVWNSLYCRLFDLVSYEKRYNDKRKEYKQYRYHVNRGDIHAI